MPRKEYLDSLEPWERAEHNRKKAEYQRMRYHTDPEYRQKAIQATRDYRRKVTPADSEGVLRKLSVRTRRLNTLAEKHGSRGLVTIADVRRVALDKRNCQNCGRWVARWDQLQLDHNIPLDAGGQNVASNLRRVCKDCIRYA